MQGRGIASPAGLPPRSPRINGGKVSPGLSTRLRRRMQGRGIASRAGLPPSVPPYQRGEGFAGIVNSSAATDAGARHCLARRSTPLGPPVSTGGRFRRDCQLVCGDGCRGEALPRAQVYPPRSPRITGGKVSPGLSTRLRRRMQGRGIALPAGLPPSVPPYQRGEAFAGIVNSSAATDAGARYCLARRSTPLGPPVSTGGRFCRDCQLVCGDGCRGVSLPPPLSFPRNRWQRIRSQSRVEPARRWRKCGRPGAGCRLAILSAQRRHRLPGAGCLP